MRRPLWIALSVVLFGCAGCFTGPREPIRIASAPPPPSVPLESRPTGAPVRAEQITLENYREKLQALEQEIARDEQQQAPSVALSE